MELPLQRKHEDVLILVLMEYVLGEFGFKAVVAGQKAS